MPVNPHTDSHSKPAPACQHGSSRFDRSRLLRRCAAQVVAVSTCLLGLVSPGHATPALPIAPSIAAEAQTLRLNVPDVPVLDQNGKRRSFYRDLVAGRSVAINFIFTSCTSICSPLSATFKAMQTEVARKAGGDVHFISVSVDPLSDTPQELSKFAKKFEAGPGWTFVTGSRASIDAILKAYDVSAGDPNDHSPMIYLGHEPSKRWVRTYGLASPQQLVERLTGLSKVAPAEGKTDAKVAESTANSTPELGAMRQIAAQQASRASVVSAASGTRGADYFTNLPLMTQDRPRVRFYDDLIRNRVVLITSFYTSCKDVCSPVSFNLAKVQEMLAQEVDTPVQLISISTDSGIDTPEVLRDFARRHNAQPGWSFVTGKPENVNWVLHKLGMYNDKPEQHSAVLWVGNDRTGAWLKLHALAPPQAILEAVRKVL
jgi:cytochrome oxidase Cu insertion factor (SCO1/SenC/PrrC family)